MLDSPARTLILSLAALMTLVYLFALLPGNPDVSTRGFVLGVAVQGLIVWRLLHRSSIAWFIAVLEALLFLLSFLLIGGPYDAALEITLVLVLLQAGLLFTPPVLAYVFRDE
jgi:hypothetical protein